MIKSDPNNATSYSSNFRRKRLRLFSGLLVAQGLTNLDCIDIGGTLSFWKSNLKYFKPGSFKKITIVNLNPSNWKNVEIENVQVNYFSGDARKLDNFPNYSFDICFSNSVIEHVGNIRDQADMASEVRRIAKFWFIQTPAKSFPIEPHFYLPWFQYYPLSFKIWLHQNYNLGFMNKKPNKLESYIDCETTRLLTLGDVKLLFPDSKILNERFFFLIKSYMVTNLG